MKRTPIKPMSDKMKALNAEYAKAKRIWWKGHDGQCGVRLNPDGTMAPKDSELPRCRNKAQHTPHHMRRRGPFLCATEFFMGACWSHHHEIHQNERLAKQLGYLFSTNVRRD